MSWKTKHEWADIEIADRANDRCWGDVTFRVKVGKEYTFLRESVFMYPPSALPKTGVWWPYHGHYGKGVVHVVECPGIEDNNRYCLKRYYIRKFSKKGKEVICDGR